MGNMPDAVVNADALLEHAETIDDHEKGAWQLLDAFRLLKTLISADPEGDWREYCENRMRSYLMAQLRKVSDVNEPDDQTRIWYFAIFAIYRDLVEQVLNKAPELRPWHEACLE